MEKYCKGVLLANGMGFLRTHDLAELLATLPPAFVLTEAEQDDADRLAAYAVNTRYPPRSRVTVAEMHEAARIAAHFARRLRPLVLAGLT